MASPRALVYALSTHWDTVEFLVRLSREFAVLTSVFRSIVTDDSGIVTGDPGHPPQIGHVRPKRSVTFAEIRS